jgi:hypothetical protein
LHQDLYVDEELIAAASNTPAAAKHVGKVEKQIQIIKERSRGIICTLPYPHLSQQMLIHLLHL